MKTLRELYNLEPNITKLHVQPFKRHCAGVRTIDRVDSWKLSKKMASITNAILIGELKQDYLSKSCIS
jgi:hypothetical protein